VDITPKVTLHRKVLGEMPVCQLTRISECDFTIQKRLIQLQRDDEARVILYAHGWSKYWSKCSERYPELWAKV